MEKPDGFDGQSDTRYERDSITQKIVCIQRSNVSLYDLYAYAFKEGDTAKNFLYDYSRIVAEISNPEPFTFPTEQEKIREWEKRNKYSYELRVPNFKADAIYKIMQNDLERYFGYTAIIEKRKIKCLVLRANGAFLLLL